MTSSGGSWLITGAAGLLGANAALELSASGGVTGVARTVPAHAPVPFLAADLSRAGDRAGLVERSGADVVLHAAAISTIEQSDRDPALAHEVNVVASADLAAQAREGGRGFVYISTDAVFDGTRGAYAEQDAASPQSVYGRTKLDGEQAVLDAHPGALVARINFYGWSPSGRRSLAEFFYRSLSAGEPVNGFDDQVVSTLYVGYLVEAIRDLVAAGASGVVHVASGEPTTKFAFGQRLASAFGFDPELVRAARSDEHLAHRRGSRLDLDTAKMEGLLGRPSIGQQQSIDRLVADRDAGRALDVESFRAREETA
ncbi:MAG TPA: sugar nucleotide-binding protein [Pseudolysinimonas sp.]